MTSKPQLQLMTSGRRAAAAWKAPVGFTKFIFTIVTSTPGATAKALADSPVPWPEGSISPLVAPGPRTTRTGP